MNRDVSELHGKLRDFNATKLFKKLMPQNFKNQLQMTGLESYPKRSDNKLSKKWNGPRKERMNTSKSWKTIGKLVIIIINTIIRGKILNYIKHYKIVNNVKDNGQIISISIIT